ncbi:metal-dependent hydrolase [Streptomyces apocyni]|uniref:metal-dependent hydrolase n=1 Tax=Streptomyces apocyni TaxID=2654677 RepID=UPI0012E9A5B5|nr:metal-dependent hydrolase [Streptomyces apocyni]
MMGPAHSLSGAAAWLGVGAIVAATGHDMPWPVLVVGALICAGAALAPDLDQKSATISTSFGPLSRTLAVFIDKLSTSVYKATRKPGDPVRRGGHRTLTHTAVWALLLGAGFSVAAMTGDRWAVLGILFVHVTLAIEGLMWRATRGTSASVLVWLLAATSAWILAGVLDKAGNGSDWFVTGTAPEYAWLGLPILLGAMVHNIGDGLTVSGCPILWPLPIGRRRWYPVGTPRIMRFRAGSWVEVKILMPTFMVLGGACGVLALNLF